MSSRDPAHDFFCSRWAFPLDQPRVVSTRLAVYNFKSSQSNGSASLFRKEDLATFKSSHLASSMAQSSTCCSPRQNPHDGKDELASGTSTEGSNRCTPISAATHAPTPAITPIITLLIASGSADSSVVRYSENNLQQILSTVLDFGPSAPVLVPVVATALHYEGPREWSLKAWFPNIYWGKTYLECYNFFLQFKDHFATTNATGLNRVLFAATFLKNIILFCWQQHQHKIEDQTNVPISWGGFKTFFCQSLGKSEVFVDTIWSTIRKNFQHQLKEVIN